VWRVCVAHSPIPDSWERTGWVVSVAVGKSSAHSGRVAIIVHVPILQSGDMRPIAWG